MRCSYWWHIKCAGISPNEYKKLSESTDQWICSVCHTFQFTDSFFSCNGSIQSDLLISYEDPVSDVFNTITALRKSHQNKCMCAFLT